MHLTSLCVLLAEYTCRCLGIIIFNNFLFKVFAENAELCELANSQTSVLSLKRQSPDYRICKLTTVLNNAKANGYQATVTYPS